MGLQKAIIEEFKSVYVNQSDTTKLESALNGMQYAIQRGVLFNIECFKGKSNTEIQGIVEAAVNEYGVNKNKVNSTFYKRFSDVENRSELELRFDQLVHYMSTYGQGYTNTEGQIYEPEFLKDIDMDINHQLVYIDAITKDELSYKIKTMLTSGVALSEKTQNNVMLIIDETPLYIDYVDQITNREFMCRLCDKLTLLPKNFDEFTRYLVYLATGSALLIKSRETYNRLAMDGLDVIKVQEAFNQYVHTFGIEQVAKNITRYRKLYLLIRKHLINKTKLNRALKLSKKLYVPREKSPLEHVLDPNVSVEEIEKSIKQAPIYKLIKVYNYVTYSMTDGQARYFKIRNGKSFLKVQGKDNSDAKLAKTKVVQDAIWHELQERLGSWKDKVFYIPQFVDYAVPTSAKDFVGSLPYMSKYHFDGKKLSIGVAWDQPADLDLHALTLDGLSVGWNSAFRDEYSSIVFSGDMTNLNSYGYAAEFIRLDPKKLKEPLIITVNQYFSGQEVTKFDVFTTGMQIDKQLKQGVATQIDADSVLFHDSVNENDGRSKTLAIVIPTNDGGCNVVYTGINYGNTRVSGFDDATKQLIEVMKNQSESTLMLRDLITGLGGKIAKSTKIGKTFGNNKQLYVPVDVDAPEIIDLDPSKVTQSTFIDLLAETKGGQIKSTNI